MKLAPSVVAVLTGILLWAAGMPAHAQISFGSLDQYRGACAQSGGAAPGCGSKSRSKEKERRPNTAAQARDFNNRAIAAAQANDYDQAASLLTQAIRLDPDNSTIRKNLEFAEARAKELREQRQQTASVQRQLQELASSSGASGVGTVAGLGFDRGTLASASQPLVFLPAKQDSGEADVASDGAETDWNEFYYYGPMRQFATAQGWDANKVRAVDAKLRKLPFAAPAALSDASVKDAWRRIDQRLGLAELTTAAVVGPVLSRSGVQTAGFDCTIFALASAADLPYGVVAARAGEMVRSAEWRTDFARERPQWLLERGRGLIGEEVVLLAEAFGQSDIIAPNDFAATLRQGHPVLVDVAVPSPSGYGAHQIVLSGTFERNGATWFEALDSTNGPNERVYFSRAELDQILLENGVVYRPNPGTVVRLLR